MLRFILVDATYFDGDDDRAQTERDLIWEIEALAQRNMSYLARRPSTPPLYKAGVVWQKPAQFNGDPYEVKILRDALGSKAKGKDVSAVLDTCAEVFGGERFRDIGRIIENGGGDCDNLCAWRVAELRQAGIQARPMMTSRQRDGGVTYHAIVRWPPFGDDVSGNPTNESDEDPSLLLGMAQPERKAERDEEIRKNQERCDYIKRCRARGVQPGNASANLNAALEDVLGFNRHAVDAALRHMLRGGAW